MITQEQAITWLKFTIYPFPPSESKQIIEIVCDSLEDLQILTEAMRLQEIAKLFIERNAILQLKTKSDQPSSTQK